MRHFLLQAECRYLLTRRALVACCIDRRLDTGMQPRLRRCDGCRRDRLQQGLSAPELKVAELRSLSFGSLQVAAEWYVGDSPHPASAPTTRGLEHPPPVGQRRARGQARPLKTVKGRQEWSADHTGSDRRWRDRSPGSMRGLLWRNRYRLGQWPVLVRDGAARTRARCTVRPAQAGGCMQDGCTRL